ncbi:MAG: inorganic diphosphatase [Myxococcales bacterium]|nr:inorganic diphosphatase [Polyangiaceae bacterium]MDW8247989.1 inorganic diphosphatase [Myxococcales bacterium]
MPEKPRAKTPFDRLSPTSACGSLHVVVESPAGSRNKYKYDPKLGLFRLNRVLPYEASFPFDYGFAPGTRSGDDDPLDVVLLADAPTFPGCIVRARPIGVLRARKEGVVNDRLLAVPLVSRIHHDVHSLEDLSPGVLLSIERFFRTILNIEGGEHQLGGFQGVEKAAQIIAKASEKRTSRLQKVLKATRAASRRKSETK